MVQSLPALIKLRCFYLDGVSPGAMASTHVAVALSHSRADGQVSVLAVHVVGSRSGNVSEPDAKVLNLKGLLLNNLLNTDNLASGLLELAELTKEVPETENLRYKIMQAN